MRAEEGKKTSGVYCTVPFPLWTQSRVEKIKQNPALPILFSVCFRGGGEGNGRENNRVGVKERKRQKDAEQATQTRNTLPSVPPPWQLYHAQKCRS